jgi:4-hydroxybenzoate polyprenyltransferase
MTNEKKDNTIRTVLIRYMRLDDVIKWTAISFIGFILGTTVFTLQQILIPFLVFLFATFLIVSFCFAINNYYDADSDRENPRRMHKNALAAGDISKKQGMTLNILFIIISFLIVAWYNPGLLYYLVILFVWPAAYSVPPVRLKGRPGIDVLWHFFGFFFLVLWGSLVAGSLPLLTWLAAISLGVFSCIGQLWNHYVDYEFDKESGTKTYAVQVGLDTTKKTLNIVLGIHVILLLLLLVLYSSHYLITLLIFVAGMILGFLVFLPKKGGFPTRKSIEFYLTITVGGSVYISCLFYHLFSALGFHLIQIY